MDAERFNYVIVIYVYFDVKEICKKNLHLLLLENFLQCSGRLQFNLSYDDSTVL